jgi:hypothetical protein
MHQKANMRYPSGRKFKDTFSKIHKGTNHAYSGFFVPTTPLMPSPKILDHVAKKDDKTEFPKPETTNKDKYEDLVNRKRVQNFFL